jgi:hypothetical protein
VPTAYDAEWGYLQSNTNLWHRWEAESPAETKALEDNTPDGQVLIECLGHIHCQRSFRSITCRAFPFFPYLSRQSDFLGISYYWQYEDRCWVINHLDLVSSEYVQALMATYQNIFDHVTQEQENFRYHSIIMRRVFGRQKREIPLIVPDGKIYLVRPRDGRLTQTTAESLPKFGDYAVAAEMIFPDEL